jgi:hypothetical protein
MSHMVSTVAGAVEFHYSFRRPSVEANNRATQQNLAEYPFGDSLSDGSCYGRHSLGRELNSSDNY